MASWEYKSVYTTYDFGAGLEFLLNYEAKDGWIFSSLKSEGEENLLTLKRKKL